MPDKFIINGNRPLEGEIRVGGYKNAAGPILIASLLTEQDCVFDNLPLINDILNIIEVLKSLGTEVEWLGKRKIKIKKNNSIRTENMDFEKAGKTRMSVLFIGALISRLSRFKIVRPGGDRIGLRPIVTHLEALEKMGVKIEQEGDFYYFQRENLKGQDIVLQEFSVTATENIILASVLLKGETTIVRGAAAEPQIQDLITMLNLMGADIEKEGDHIIKIKGVEKLAGVEYRIMPDPSETGTFIVMAALTPGQVKIQEAIPDNLTLFLAKAEKIGVNFKIKDQTITVDYSPNLKAIKVQALPSPGFPTDLLPIIVPLLVRAEGRSLIHDPLYENRLRYVDELRKMGADIEIVDPHRAFVFGHVDLQGRTVESGDVRAGASLVIAGLMADGQTIIEHIDQIDRGYEKIEERLQLLGADIKRIKG